MHSCNRCDAARSEAQGGGFIGGNANVQGDYPRSRAAVVNKDVVLAEHMLLRARRHVHMCDQETGPVHSRARIMATVRI